MKLVFVGHYLDSDPLIHIATIANYRFVTNFLTESQQKIEFVNVENSLFTWHEGREICLQQHKDLCLSRDICVNPGLVFATQEVTIPVTKYLWIPIRYGTKQ